MIFVKEGALKPPNTPRVGDDTEFIVSAGVVKFPKSDVSHVVAIVIN